jgi:adenosylmethionine-8-amino-7-oxononanoate aminotransferase
MANLEELDRAHLIHPITELRKHEKVGPSIVTGGEGIRIHTADGRTLIDGCSGLWNVNVGHGRTEIGDAVAKQMRDVPYYPGFWEYSTEPAIRLAERMAKLMPPGAEIDRFLFTSGGSDANETNFRIARTYHAARGEPNRRKILSRANAYHGITYAAGSATRLPAYHIFATPDPLHVEVPAPYCFRCELGKTFPACELACADAIEQAIEREGAETVAAIVAEPVFGTGGIIPPPDGYFQRLREVCDRHGILLILDEVITGFGRTGQWFGMQTYDIRPDLVTFAKGITSGYLPLGAAGVSRRVYESLRDDAPQGLPFMGGLTYNNHATCCAAAGANLDILESACRRDPRRRNDDRRRVGEARNPGARRQEPDGVPGRCQRAGQSARPHRARALGVHGPCPAAVCHPGRYRRDRRNPRGIRRGRVLSQALSLPAEPSRCSAGLRARRHDGRRSSGTRGP